MNTLPLRGGVHSRRRKSVTVTAQKKPLVSVVIANWNGRSLLPACLDSLGSQTFRDTEIIVVDNGSTDGSQEVIRSGFPNVHLVALTENLGFAPANNIALRHAKGEYIALLNNDTEADPLWLETLLSALAKNEEIGFCASKMVLHHDRRRADSCGDYYTVEGVAGKRGHLELADRYNDAREVFGACAGAAMYRRSMIEDIGLFDDDFFMVHEDSDLSFRAQLMGYKCLYVPGAVVSHRESATIGHTTYRSVYYAQRNAEFVYLKNMPLPLILKYWPLHILLNGLLFVGYSRRGLARPFVKAKFDFIASAPHVMEKRRSIQRGCRVGVDQIEDLLTKGWLRDKIGRRLQAYPGE
jgi:GT2 family glycosyltransferase